MALNSRLYRILSISIILLLSSFWILKNLDLCSLWQDEAETACVSSTIAKYGIPKGTDGLNFFSQQEGREYGPNYEWKLHPWFQFYWTAASFQVFGQSTWSARFPFALLGIATILLSFFLAKRIWKDEKTAYFVVAALLLNIFFILLVRQARYYAPVMFFSVYAVWGLMDILEKKRIGYLHFILASLLFFQSQYLFCINFWVVTLGFTFLFYKDRFKYVALAIGIAALPSIPFLIWVLDTPYGETLSTVKSQPNVLHGLQLFAKNFFYYVLQPQWLVVLAILLVLKTSLKSLADFDLKKEHWALFFALLIVGNIVVTALVVPEYYIRYICATVPFGILVITAIAHHLAKINMFIPWLLLVWSAIFMGDLGNYITELKQDKFLGPIDGYTNFIEKKAGKEATIAITYGDLPLKFYLPNKIYGGMAGDLPENLDSIDIFIIRTNIIYDFDAKVSEKITQYIEKNIANFQAFSIPVEDSPFQNRETPHEHYYKTQTVKNPIVIHERIKK